MLELLESLPPLILAAGAAALILALTHHTLGQPHRRHVALGQMAMH